MECIETFTTTDIGELETDVNSWLEQNSDVTITDRKFAMCSVTDHELRDRTIAQFGYVIVYQEGE